VRLDVSNLLTGDRAGICILQDPYAMLAVEKTADGYQLVWKQDKVRDAGSSFTPSEQKKTVAIDSVIYLRAAITKNTDKTKFYYSLDNKTFTAIGGETQMSFNLTVFVGARFGIFCYAANEGEGYADFDWFSTETNYDESMFYPADFEGFNEDMLTLERLTLEKEAMEVMVGNSSQMELTATYRDGHATNVAAMARYDIAEEGIIEISNGRIRGLSDGTAHVHARYTDPLGNEQTTDFTVRSTFFPFGKEYINTSLFGEGSYNEATHTFKTAQYGQVGWEYPNGADMSAYKYLVVKLKNTASGVHLNIFTDGSIWASNYETAAFGSKKQIVVNLKTAKYTNGDKKGQALDTKNIRIVDFWGDRATITLDDIYLTNNDDYTPGGSSGIDNIMVERSQQQPIYDLQGRKIGTTEDRSSVSGKLKPGFYIINKKKVIVR
jgi:hypothetical protein